MKWILSTALIAAVAPGALAERISTKPASMKAQKTNIRAFVELLRADVRAEKTANLASANRQSCQCSTEVCRCIRWVSSDRIDRVAPQIRMP